VDQRVLITGDRDLLFDAVSNLADNAIKYGREAGRVTVEVTRNGGALISVADDGPGIPTKWEAWTRERSMAHLAATADRLDYRIRRHAVEWHCGKTNKTKFNPNRDRLAGLSAIGRSLSLRDQYDALTARMPPRLAAVVEQLETNE
jgi:hypothetical protein